MAGYGNRTEPSQGTIHDLFVKALAVEDSLGTRAVIVTADLIGYTREFTEAVAGEVERRTGIPRAAILFNSSHTHCGPEVRPAKGAFVGMPEAYQAKVVVYETWLRGKFADVIADAVKGMRPAEISFSTASPVPFAESRRFQRQGGVLYSSPRRRIIPRLRDDTVPVLRVRDPGGAVRAVVFGYACHPITLAFDFFCGDYPGFAQRYIEEAFPGAVAMFVQGCAGELVPNSRFQIEYAMGHGRALADAVKKRAPDAVRFRTASGCFRGAGHCVHTPPDRKTLEEQAKTSGVVGTRRSIFSAGSNGTSDPPDVPCPVQASRSGRDFSHAIGARRWSIMREHHGRIRRQAGLGRGIPTMSRLSPTKKDRAGGRVRGRRCPRQTIFPGPFGRMWKTVSWRARGGGVRVLDLGRPSRLPFVAGKIAVDGSSKTGEDHEARQVDAFGMVTAARGSPIVSAHHPRTIDGEKTPR